MVVQWLQVHLPIQRASLVAQLVKNVGDLGLIPGPGVGGGGRRVFHALYSPWGCSDLDRLSDFQFPIQTFQVQSLVGELRCHMMCSHKPKEKTEAVLYKI